MTIEVNSNSDIEYFDAVSAVVFDIDAWWFDGPGFYFLDNEGVWVGPWDTFDTAESARLEAEGAFI